MRSRCASSHWRTSFVLWCAFLACLGVLFTPLSVEHCQLCFLNNVCLADVGISRLESLRVLVLVLAIVMSGIPSAESLAHLDAWLVLSDVEDVLVRCWTRFAVPSDSTMFQVLCALAYGSAGDDWRVGMATSRLAQMLVTAIGRLGSSRIRSWLDAQKIAAVDQESEVLLPHLKAGLQVIDFVSHS